MKENSILRYLLVLVITLMFTGLVGIKIQESRIEKLEDRVNKIEQEEI